MGRKRYSDEDVFRLFREIDVHCTIVLTLSVRAAKLGFLIRVIIIGARSLEVFLVHRFLR